MNIKGLDYNTHREKLLMPEYGREIQKMVDYAVSLTDKSERQDCALEISKLSSLSREPDGILEQGDSRVFLEQINIGRKLVICGAGHVALSVIRIGVMLGFEVTVIEDR